MSNFLELATQIQTTLKALQMYTANHPRAQEALQKLTTTLGRWLDEKSSLQLVVNSGQLFVDGATISLQSIHANALVRQFSERQITGFILRRGIPTTELLAMLNLLILKPARIEEQGGAAQILAKQNLQYVELTQTHYREVRDDAPYKEAQGTAAPTGKAETVSKPSAGADALAALGISAMVQRWQANLEHAVPMSPRPETGAPGETSLTDDLAFLGPVAEGMGWDAAPPSNPQIESLRHGLLALPAEKLFSILENMDSLPEMPVSFRKAFHELAPELLGQASDALLLHETDWGRLKERISHILQISPEKQALLAGLEKQLRSRTQDISRVQELMCQLEWEHSSMEARIQRVQEGMKLLDLTLEQRLAFLQQLLEGNQIEPLLQVLDQVLEALAVDEPLLREAAALTLAGVTRWMIKPGLPAEAEGPLIQGLTAHFGWEPVPQIHRPTMESMECVLACLVQKGELTQTLSLLQEMDGLCAFLEGNQEWRKEALTHLRGTLSEPDLLKRVLEALQAAPPENLLDRFVPYLEFIGETAAFFLVDSLGQEPDRKRRGRLLDMIRVMGQLSFPALRAGLRSPAWYLVRNTLNLLADIGDANILTDVIPALRHGDPRVRRAAVRAVWKLGGPEGTPHILSILGESDPDTQVEILFGLGQTRAKAAAAPIAALAQNQTIPEKVRIKAADTLGLIGAPESIPDLVELIQHKGRIFTTKESTELRLAAARALGAIKTPQAMAALSKLADDEPGGTTKEAFVRILALHAWD